MFLRGDWEVVVLGTPVEVVEDVCRFVQLATQQSLMDEGQAQFAAIGVSGGNEAL